MNATPPLYPLMFQPVYKNYVWGGNRIPRRYNRSVPPGIYAESWELTDRAEGINVVVNGSLAGKDLHDLTQTYGVELLGRPMARFPLLIKLIDAKERLSVQVHPDETSAAAIGGEPKAEMWFVLDAEAGAKVYVGLKAGVKQTAFNAALATGQVGDLLEAFPVSRGDVIYIPGGCVHTIGEGCLMLEIQQNSDTTYRVFDWNRIGSDGKPRGLHLEQARKVMHWPNAGDVHHPLTPAIPVPPKTNAITERLATPYFRFEQIALAGILDCPLDHNTFHALFLDEGFVRLKSGSVLVDISPGTTVLVPAGLKEYEVANLNTGGPSYLLRASLP